MKIKVISTFLVFTGFCPVLFGQVTDVDSKIHKQNTDTVLGWKKGGILSLSLAQGSFTNWAAGGQNSIALSGLVSMYANRKSSKSTWDNSLDIGYGRQKLGKNDWIKTDDKFEITSKFGREISKKLFYAGLANFKTQMDEGYNYPNDTVAISSFLAPAYLILALGIDYKPNEDISIFAAPFTLRTIIVNNQSLADAGSFGVDPAIYDTSGILISHGKKIEDEFGGYLRLTYTKKEIIKNVSFNTKFDLFSNYLKNPQNMVISWETLISLKVNKYISAVVSTLLLYDDAVKIQVDENKKGPRIQFKEIIGVGFSYNF